MGCVWLGCLAWLLGVAVPGVAVRPRRASAFRMKAVASYPSITGILQSMKMTSKPRSGPPPSGGCSTLPFSSKRCSMHSLPSHATVTVWPSVSSMVFTTSMLKSLSSATNMLAVRAPASVFSERLSCEVSGRW